MIERRMLQSLHCEVLVARNGLDAVALALANAPDLILIDAAMPALNGFDATRRLRAADITKHTPIIIVTGRGEECSVSEGFDAGCTDYVAKPFDSFQLLSKLKIHLPGLTGQ